MRPRLLDLFCGAGGAAMGYHRAGFDVVGVDIKPQPHYPFEFIQGDALAVLELLGRGSYVYQSPLEIGMEDFVAIHASPPCQAFSWATARHAKPNHPNLIPETRDRLMATGLPWVMENVPRAPLRPDYKLCGCMFGLPHLKRERWFETSWHAFELRPACYHPDWSIAVVDGGIQTREIERGWRRLLQSELHPLRSRAMGIDWMPSRHELAEAIPPAYTEHIGAQLLDHLKERAAS